MFSFASGSVKKPAEKKEKAPSAFKDRFYRSDGLLCLPTAFSLVQLIKETLPVPWAALPGYSLRPGGFAPERSPELAADPPLSLSLAQEVAEVLAIGGREKQGPPGHPTGTTKLGFGADTVPQMGFVGVTPSFSLK